MAAPRKRTTLARRRRMDEESDAGSAATELADDSQSDISLPSDIDEDADADNSDLSETDHAPSVKKGKNTDKANGSPRSTKPRQDVTSRRAPSPPIARSDAAFTASKNTDLMRNGLKIADQGTDGAEEVVDFETGALAVDSSPPSGRPETLAERRRREHEDYKKKRDADPAFIPNRGAFFMHDQRNSQGQGGFRQFGPRGGARGGRGGGAIGGPYAPANMRPQPVEAADSPWQHDLHETVIDSGPQSQRAPRTNAPPDVPSNPPPQQLQGPPSAPAQRHTPPRNFSTTVHTANAQVRVSLPGMRASIYFQNVPLKQHTRLPNHRPPLRRDKPVRISLPPSAPRYIFPTVDRSFIFIPRALRPNQQGFGRGRGRGFGSYGAGFSSRRTSAYGGSVYSPSIAMSRRSSLAHEMGRDGMVSPAGSVMSRQGGFVDPARPVVRMPPGGPRMPTGPPMMSPQNGTMMPPQSYPLPQKPAFRENWHGQLPMHQPRPQKNVNVAGIESPASMNFIPPQQQEQQPFHQQVPAHTNGSAPPADQAGLYPHTRQLSFHSQASTGTPLSNIPERAIHAPAFQPVQQPYYQPQPYAMPQGYYPPNGTQPFVPQAAMMPVFVPNAQQPYVVPMAAPAAAPAPAATGQANMVAYEWNGVTYYGDPAQMPVYTAAPMDGYAQASYAVPGMGGMMTPSPEGAGYYYPQQMQQPMQPGAPVYYPSQ